MRYTKMLSILGGYDRQVGYCDLGFTEMHDVASFLDVQP